MDFIIGLVVGAAFAPFWMMIWKKIKDYIFPPKP
jgi:hypothetical protein